MAAKSGIKIKVKKKGEISIVEIDGAIKSGMEFDLADELESCMHEAKVPKIIVDMKKVPFINSAALGILLNIYKEIESDLGIKKDFSNGNLKAWAQQGVFLLNSVLTVEAGLPASHKGLGWEAFTDTVITTISDRQEHVVFMLWGNFAKSKRGLIDTKKHLVLEAAHPSPFSAHSGFFGCKHFSKGNVWLKKCNEKEIKW